jgi:hypothetical protein
MSADAGTDQQTPATPDSAPDQNPGPDDDTAGPGSFADDYFGSSDSTGSGATDSGSPLPDSGDTKKHKGSSHFSNRGPSGGGGGGGGGHPAAAGHTAGDGHNDFGTPPADSGGAAKSAAPGGNDTASSTSDGSRPADGTDGAGKDKPPTGDSKPGEDTKPTAASTDTTQAPADTAASDQTVSTVAYVGPADGTTRPPDATAGPVVPSDAATDRHTTEDIRQPGHFEQAPQPDHLVAAMPVPEGVQLAADVRTDHGMPASSGDAAPGQLTSLQAELTPLAHVAVGPTVDAAPPAAQSVAETADDVDPSTPDTDAPTDTVDQSAPDAEQPDSPGEAPAIEPAVHSPSHIGPLAATAVSAVPAAAAPVVEKFSDVYLATGPHLVLAADIPVPKDSGPRRTPAEAASDLVGRWHGKLVDPGGALNETYRRTMDPANVAKEKAGGELHVPRTAAAKELADLNHLLKDPTVQRVEVVKSSNRERTNDFDVYYKDGSKARWEVTTVTSAPLGRLRSDSGTRLVDARQQRIPSTSQERQAALHNAIVGKREPSQAGRPPQLEGKRSDGFPTGGTLSVHAPFLNSTRKDCDAAVKAATPTLSAHERDVVVWRMERSPKDGALRNVGEHYVRAADGSYRHAETIGAPAGKTEHPATSPKAADGHATPTKAPDHQAAPTKAPEHHATPTKTTEHQTASTKTTEHHADPTRTPEHHAAPTKTPEHHAGPARTPERQASPAKTTEHHADPTRIPEHHATPTKAPEHQTTSTKTTEHHAGPARASEHQAGPAKAAEHSTAPVERGTGAAKPAPAMGAERPAAHVEHPPGSPKLTDHPTTATRPVETIKPVEPVYLGRGGDAAAGALQLFGSVVNMADALHQFSQMRAEYERLLPGIRQHLSEHPKEGALVVVQTVSTDVPQVAKQDSVFQPASRFVEIHVYYGPTLPEARSMRETALSAGNERHRYDNLYWFPPAKPAAP